MTKNNILKAKINLTEYVQRLLPFIYLQTSGELLGSDKTFQEINLDDGVVSFWRMAGF